MGFERVALFGLIDIELESTGSGLISLSTDLPSNAMAVKETKPIAATGRRVVRFRLQGTTKGRLYSLKIAPAPGAIIRLYGARLWVRILPGQAWEWVAVPVPETGDWQQVKLPIPPMGDWTPAKLPIPPTSEEWTPAKLPIPGVGEWTPAKLPIPPTSEEWTPAKLPIPEVGEWTAAKLPIKPTPQNPEWVDIPVDQ